MVAISHVTLLHVPSISPAPGNCLRHGLCSSSPAPVDMDPQRHPQPLWCAPVTWSILRRGCPSCCTLWKKWYVLKLLPGHSCHILLFRTPRGTPDATLGTHSGAVQGPACPHPPCLCRHFVLPCSARRHLRCVSCRRIRGASCYPSYSCGKCSGWCHARVKRRKSNRRQSCVSSPSFLT